MNYRQLSPVHASRYSNLLQALDHSFVEGFGMIARKGSFVSRTVNGKKHWYFQHMVKSRQEHLFLGPDSLELSVGFVFRGEVPEILASLNDSGVFLSGLELGPVRSLGYAWLNGSCGWCGRGEARPPPMPIFLKMFR